MRLPDIFVAFLLLGSCCILFSCNDSTTTSGTNAADTAALATNVDTSGMPSYDPAMDPYKIRGEGIKRIGDSLGIRLYEFIAKPGDSAELHSHPDHAVYVLQGGTVAVTFKGAGRQIMEFKAGTGFIGGPLSDAGKNIGNTTVRLLVVDIHRPRAK